ncbi:MAG: rRNA maturation RNase YbeY [Bacteroidota bacterium]|nr:rRNA maturation RNase YbeY [Bacteroidota bacterium]
MNIKFFYDGIKFRVRKAGEIKRFLGRVITEKKKLPGDLNFIFTTDDTILGINREFLNHNYYTDVISFDFSTGKELNYEIYISIDTLKRNASYYKVSMNEELIRVMIHGILHLCGYDDSDDDERDKMFTRQESLVKEFKRSI